MSGPAATGAADTGLWRAAAQPRPGEPVAVALSGGVDSAVAAWTLVQQGCDVVGVTTRNFCYGEPPFSSALGARSCCSAQAVEAARELCAGLRIPHVVLDLARPFQEGVIDDFILEYRSGRTPNPCVRCNERVRFPGILAWARGLGIARIATGHFARLQVDAAGQAFVARGRDAAKDQSYFLYRVPPALLALLAFPVGDKTKEEVRRTARAHGLPMAETPESQEICFLPDGDRRPLVGDGEGPGEIVDEAGRVLGTHPGLPHFTVGQRKGLGLAGGAPRYVVRLEPGTNRVVVGDAASLLRDELECDEAFLRDPLAGGPGLIAKTRYRHAGLPVREVRLHGQRLQVALKQPDRAPALGQAVVLYRGDVVVGGGRLVEVSCAS
jgi:tRNA-specific 2-thiouridylase